MRKDEIRSLIRNTALKIDKTAIFHDRYIDATVEKVLASLYEDIWRFNPLNLQRYTKSYGYTVPIIVSTEVATGIKYSNLPESILVFQDKSSGVRRISTPAQGAMMFFPMDFREIDLATNGCYFDTVNTKVGYAVNQTRVEYYNIPTSIVTSGVRMDLIVPFSKYLDSDEVKIPEITDKDGQTFIDKVLKILGVVQPPDLIDDNASPEPAKRNS
jgi:hypothetical protein